MQRGRSEALAEGGSGQGQVPLQGGEVFPPPVLAFLFARQVDPRHLCHTEGLKVIVKLSAPRRWPIIIKAGLQEFCTASARV